METLFESRELRVLHLPGSGPAWITFASAEREPAFGLDFIQGRGEAGVFFLPARDHWYQLDEIWPAIAAADRALAGVSRRITYGSSMGGMAAIAYASDLHADLVIAADPQVSVDPALVWHFDQRFPNGTAFTAGRRDAREGIGDAEVVLIYDPLHRIDAKHVRMLPGRRVRFPMAGHAAFQTLSECLILKPLIAAIVDGDWGAVRPLKQEYRRVRGLAAHFHLAQGVWFKDHHRFREALGEFAHAMLITPHLAASHGEFASLLYALNRREEAVAAIQRALLIFHDWPIFEETLDNMLAGVGRAGQSSTSSQSIDTLVRDADGASE